MIRVKRQINKLKGKPEEILDWFPAMHWYPYQEETKYLWLLMLRKEGYASNTSKE